MIIVGIDPGKSGAIFALSDDNYCYADMAFAVPLLSIKRSGKGKTGKAKTPKTEPDFVAWHAQWSMVLRNADHVFIEKVGSMPKQGVTSMFNFGRTLGFAYAMVVGSGKPHTFITPQSWKKTIGISGDDAEVSRRRAGQLLPHAVEFWPRKKDDGMAEAALIALAGRSILRGSSDAK